MKVAFVYPHWEFRPGSEEPSQGLADSISILGYELARRAGRSCETAVYCRGPTLRGGADLLEGVDYRLIPSLPDLLLRPIRVVLKALDTAGLRESDWPVYSSRWYYRGYAELVARDLRERGADVVHVFTFPQLVEAIRQQNPGMGIVLHIHDHSLVERDRVRLEGQLEHADAIVGVSPAIVEDARRRFPRLASRFHAISNGVDPEAFRVARSRREERRGDAQSLLFVGRISPEKGLHVLLDAFELVLVDHPEARLEVVGPDAVAPRAFVDPQRADPLLSSLDPLFRRRRYARSLRTRLAGGIRGRVSFSGAVDHSRMVEHYASADVLVMPSLWREPFGIPVIEAMAASLPVVATRGGGLPDLVEDGMTGLLVERGDAPGLAVAIGSILDDAELRQQMGDCGRERATALFSWDTIIEQWLGLYRQICGAGHAERSPLVPT